MVTETIKKIFDLASELEREYPGRHFTLDGHMLGSIGEVYAAEKYGLTLYPASHEVHDAVDDMGRQVQIKITFILKTTVMSADWNHKNNENARIDPQNARIGPENARIEPPNPWVMAKNKRINDVKYLHENGAMTAITSSAIIAVLEDLMENQVISTQDVQKILDCKETKALRIINEMKKANIIVAIPGQGKGRYILNQ